MVVLVVVVAVNVRVSLYAANERISGDATMLSLRVVGVTISICESVGRTEIEGKVEKRKNCIAVDTSRWMNWISEWMITLSKYSVY